MRVYSKCYSDKYKKIINNLNWFNNYENWFVNLLFRPHNWHWKDTEKQCPRCVGVMTAPWWPRRGTTRCARGMSRAEVWRENCVATRVSLTCTSPLSPASTSQRPQTGTCDSTTQDPQVNQEIHFKSIVYLDLKTGNLLVTSKTWQKLLKNLTTCWKVTDNQKTT